MPQEIVLLISADTEPARLVASSCIAAGRLRRR